MQSNINIKFNVRNIILIGMMLSIIEVPKIEHIELHLWQDTTHTVSVSYKRAQCMHTEN